MTLTQVIRYLENGDASSITHKQFNRKERDQYPTYSVCLKGKEVYWAHENSMFEELGITSSQYADTLKGNGWKYTYDDGARFYRKEDFNLRNVSTLELKKIFPKPSDIIVGTEFQTQNKLHTTHYGIGKTKGTTMNKVPFHVGYQTPEEICFTRNSKYRLDLIRLYDMLSLNRAFLKPGNNLDVKIRIIVHYPGQLISNLFNPSFRSTFGTYRKNKVLELKISRVTKLRKRPDSNVPCNPDMDNVDQTFQLYVIKHVGCVTIYWSYLPPDIIQKPPCRSPEELRNASELIDHFRTISTKYEPPCIDMTSFVTFTRELEQLPRQFLVKVIYTENFYQEIKNVREFTFETFWSTAGGYLGFFLGYSLLQLPDLLHHFPSILRKMRFISFLGKCLESSLTYALGNILTKCMIIRRFTLNHYFRNLRCMGIVPNFMSLRLQKKPNRELGKQEEYEI